MVQYTRADRSLVSDLLGDIERLCAVAAKLKRQRDALQREVDELRSQLAGRDATLAASDVLLAAAMDAAASPPATQEVSV